MAYKNDVRKTRYVLSYGLAKERLKPLAVLSLPVVFNVSAFQPKALFPWPSKLAKSARAPLAGLKLPVVLLIAKTNRALCYPIRLCLD
jgi:hypothetical protein